MMNLFNAAETEGLGGLEEFLNRMIEPVNPDPKFVDTLKLKLSNAPVVIMDSTNRHLPWLAAATGLAAGVFLFFLLKKKQKTRRIIQRRV